MFQLSNSTRLSRQKNFFPNQKFKKLLKLKISVPYQRAICNKGSSEESSKCRAFDGITKILQFAPSPP